MKQKNVHRKDLKSRWHLQTASNLERHLGVPEEYLRPLCDCVDDLYRSWEVPKKSGGMRRIDCPLPSLKLVQERINKCLLQRTKVHRTAMGGIRGKRLVDNAKLHVGRPILGKFDLEDFFPNVTSGQVYDCFVSIGCSPDVARLLTRLTTYRGSIPQGAPTSTMLANLVAAYGQKGSFNARLERLAKKHGGSASTWVDDVAISGPSYLPRLQSTVERIARQCGFTPNNRKNKFMSCKEQQFLTGMVVNLKPNVSKKSRRILRAELDRRKIYGPAVVSDAPPEKLKARLRSKIAHVQSVNPATGAKLLAQFHEIHWPAGR